MAKCPECGREREFLMAEREDSPWRSLVLFVRGEPDLMSIVWVVGVCAVIVLCVVAGEAVIGT